MKTVALASLLIAGIALFGIVAHAEHIVNINTASQAELETLTGIGPSKSQAIISYREGPDGPFETIEEIMQVSGIKQATFDGIKDHITVSGETQIETEEDSTGEDTEASSTSDSSSSTSSSQTSAASKTTSTTVRIVAPNIVVAGAQQKFEAELSKSSADAKYANYLWNFGDGTTGRGQKINHTYSHPGKYAVILSASGNGLEAEARLTVEAVPLELMLTAEAGGVLAVKNNSKREVDIGGWYLAGGGSSFYIPQGTVVLANETLRFDPAVTNIAGDLNSGLLYPSGEVAATALPQPADSGYADFATAKSAEASSPALAKTPSSAATASQDAPVVLGASDTNEAVAAETAVPQDGSPAPLWVYALGLAALVILSIAATLYVQTQRPAATKSAAEEFEIQ